MKIALEDSYEIKKFLYGLMAKRVKIGRISFKINRIKLEKYFNLIYKIER